ncbi:MAG: YraN family protein [Demequinaceae bacterium]|nr:YraN family protein [Demequinaceae bacterium]
MTTRAELGRFGEEWAVRVLSDLGWGILARNWRCPHGEIDIVALDGDEAVIVEVKTRRSGQFGAPAEAVTPAKLSRLRRLAAAWLASQERRFSGVRIDVMAVTIRAGGMSVEHLRGVG